MYCTLRINPKRTKLNYLTINQLIHEISLTNPCKKSYYKTITCSIAALYTLTTVCVLPIGIQLKTNHPVDAKFIGKHSKVSTPEGLIHGHENVTSHR